MRRAGCYNVWVSSGETLEDPPARLRAFRAATGFTQEQLAQRLGVSFVSVNRWENGRSRPAASVWRKLEALAPAGVDAGVPEAASSFVGRAAELRVLEPLVAGHRLVTLTGPGGCGKTRLALELMRRQRGAGEAPLFVDLSAARDQAAVETAVQRALGVHDSPGRVARETILFHLGPRTRMLVFDNCEQVVEAVADLVGAVLQACPGVRILATSREALRIPAELTWRVPPLSLPVEDGAAAATKTDGVRLFVERARQRLPGFGLTAESAHAVVAICRSLDGLPLGIELAASQVNSLPLEELARRAATGVVGATGHRRGAPARHRSLRYALDWSYALLDDSERAGLRSLAVFAGGFDLDAAEAVCGGAAQVVQRLVETSLLAFDAGRYRLLATVRAFAQERLTEAGELEAVRLRHAKHYLALGVPSGPADVAASEARIQRERENYAVAMATWRDLRRGDELGRMVSNAARVWMYYGQPREGMRWLDAVLELELSPAARGQWLRAAAGIASAAMETAAAGRYFAELIKVGRSRGDDAAVSQGLLGLGTLAQWRGDAPAAVDAISEAVALCEAAGDRPGATRHRHYLGSALLTLGDWEGARAELLRTLADARADGLVESEAWAMLYLGDLEWARGEFAISEAHTRDALRLFTELGQRYSEAVARGRLAMLRSRAGDDRGAAQFVAGGYDPSVPLSFCLVALSQAIVLSRHAPETAAALLGGVQSLDELVRIVVPAPWRAVTDAASAAALAALGETRFRAAFERGAVQPLGVLCEEGLRAAREWLREIETPAAVSARELEVLARVAGGSTNKEIARDLGMSVRTAERHLVNCYAKIGARGRADAIAWMLRREAAEAGRS